MREWLKRLPWKGSDLVRGPRVRIPPPPPMKMQHIHRLFEKKMKEQEVKISSIFEWIKENPRDLSRDKEMLSEMDKMSAILEDYKEACESGLYD